MLKQLQSGAGLSGIGERPRIGCGQCAGIGARTPGGAGPDQHFVRIGDTRGREFANKGRPAAASGAPAAPLHQTPFPDGSGSIGLPDGWTITGAHAGEVIAKGPTPASLHFDWQIPALDPNDPRSRGLMRPATAASFVDIPYGTDAANTFKSAFTQFLQKHGKSPPTIEIVDSKQVGRQGSPGISQDRCGRWQWADYRFGRYRHWSVRQSGELSHHAIHHQFPAGTRAAIAGHRRCHAPQLQGQPGCGVGANPSRLAKEPAGDRSNAGGDAAPPGRLGSAICRVSARQDAQERQFQAFDNNLLDRTVIRDTDLNAHGTVSNDLADALIDANPNRFKKCPRANTSRALITRVAGI